MTKIQKPRLTNNNIEYDVDFEQFDTDNKLSHTLAMLMGYDLANDAELLARVDSDGVLLVNSSGSASDTFENSVATIDTSAGLLVAARTNRQNLYIRNNSSNDVYIGKDATVTAANGFILDSGSVLNLDNFIGSLYAIASTGSNEIRVSEVY